MPKKAKSSLSLGRKYTERKYRKKDNEEDIEIPKQNREAEVLIEADNVIGNQDDSEQAGPQKDTNVKDTTICGESFGQIEKCKNGRIPGHIIYTYLQ